MSRRALLVAAIVASAAGAGVAQAQELGLPAKVADWTPSSNTLRSFPTTDYTGTSGPREGSTLWRTVGSTGNAAEVWFTVTDAGRILDLGGSYVKYSDDQGRTWKVVSPQETLVNGEGSILEAPNGDVLGITWDPYAGDRVITYKYSAATKAWSYMAMPLHTPFWDRPSLQVVPGDFTDPLGRKTPYIAFANGLPHDPWIVSYDGLNYTKTTSPSNDVGAAIANAALDVKPDPMLDYIQPDNDLSIGLFPLFAPLGGGRAWFENSLFDGSDSQWHPWTGPDGKPLSGSLQVDSRGWLHNVVPSGSTRFVYRTSTDGGRTWKSLSVTGGAPGDFRANAAAGVAAVYAVAGHQDLVYKFDISSPQPKLIRRYTVGLGDDSRSGGVGFYGATGGHRFDFSSIGVFPDGRVAVSFMDSQTKMPFPTLSNDATCAVKDVPPDPVGTSPCEVVAPQLAIEQDTTLGG